MFFILIFLTNYYDRIQSFLILNCQYENIWFFRSLYSPISQITYLPQRASQSVHNTTPSVLKSLNLDQEKLTKKPLKGKNWRNLREKQRRIPFRTDRQEIDKISLDNQDNNIIVRLCTYMKKSNLMLVHSMFVEVYISV